MTPKEKAINYAISGNSKVTLYTILDVALQEQAKQIFNEILETQEFTTHISFATIEQIRDKWVIK
jgi:hypothetical protein